MALKIALVVDNPRRDLPGLVLLAAELARQDVTVLLVPANLQRREHWMLVPDFVLFNYLRVNNQDLARQLLDAGIFIGVLDTEGGAWGNYGKYIAGPDVREQVRCLFTWGHAMARYVEEQGWYRPDQVVVSGSPRFDFYAHPWRAAALAGAAYVQDYPQPLILIATSYPVSNSRFQSQAQIKRSYMEKFKFSEAFIQQHFTDDPKGIAALTDLANRLAARFPHASVVMRPHPFEALETYEAYLADYDNLHLSNTGTFDAWILRAAVLIHRSSSTAIDASLCSVPALSADWFPAHVVPEVVETLSVHCQSPEEAEAYVESILAGTYTPAPQQQQALEETVYERYYSADGQSHVRVAAAVLEHARQHDPARVDLERCREVVFGPRKPPPPLKTRLKQGIKRLLSRQPPRRPHIEPTRKELEWDQSPKYFDAARVWELLDAIQGAAPAGSPLAEARIGVQQANEHGDYHFNYDKRGRAVTVFPLP